MRACPGVRERIAWLLRVNRLFGSDERWAKASLFAAAFGGGCWPATANESKISRWETAALRVPTVAIRRYEELLGLAPGLLVATAESLRAYYCVEFAQRAAWSGRRPGQVPTGRIGELIDKAGSCAVMTGAEWDELTREISAVPNFYICPSATWEVLARRLLQEQIIADRVAWLQRFGALERLLKHPIAQESAISVVAELGRDSTNQVGIEVMGAMDVTSHPDASKHVLAQLTHPTSPMTFYGALLACVRKVANGHFSPEESRQLAGVVASLIGGDQVDPHDARTLAVSLLRQLPDDVPTAVTDKLRRVVQADESLSRVATTGKLGTPDQAGPFVTRVVTAAAAQMPREGPWEFDQMLAQAVDEMLYDSVPDVRLEAAFLIHATPYRLPVATALTASLSRTATAADTGLAMCIMDALRLLGGPQHRPMVERLTLSPGVPAPVMVAAARNIGHLGGTSDDRYWNHAVRLHCGPPRRPQSAANDAIVRGLVYGMGMAHNDAMLTRVRDLPGVPWQARQAASWWLGHSQRTRQSARL
ncbi:MAG TPA: hypothetical protein VHY58_17135 [Streptosporangiaceae bacterium]|jgi:hypothetical protein|nr:hypothetical protein [Streptosporangiaceae bacterium]